MKQPIYKQPDFDQSPHPKQNMGYPMMQPAYYQMFTPLSYQSHKGEMPRNESYSSLGSINEQLNFNRSPPTNEDAYVPNAASLYGSVGQGYAHQLNISHCRNATGSDLGLRYDNSLPLAVKHKQANLSHDYSLAHQRPNKIWLQPNKFRADDLLEINSSGLLTEEDSLAYYPMEKSNLNSQAHTRNVSNLDEPDYMFPGQGYMSFPEGINEISEEVKSENDEVNEVIEAEVEETNKMHVMEDIIANVLDDHSHAKPNTHKTNWKKKTIPIVAVDATKGTTINNKEKSTPQKESDAIITKIQSAEKLTKKVEDHSK